MSAFYPPSYTFTGINFNSGFFTTPTTGLTETQANAIYLRKTTPDTASALETFSAGIKTGNIDTASIGTLSLGTAVATSISIGQIGVQTSINGNLGVDGNMQSNTIYAQNPTDSINLFDTTTSGNIYFGVNSTASVVRTTGTIHIGDGNSASGGIHIGNGVSASNNVNILNGATSTGSVNIGNNTSGNIIIGGTGAMTLKGAITATTSLTSTGLITANGGITMGINKFITPSTNTITPASNQLGYTNAASIVTSGGGIGTSIAIAAFTIVAVGVYAVTLNVGSSTVSTYQLVSISTIPSTNIYYSQKLPVVSTGVSFFINATITTSSASQTIHITAEGNVSGIFGNASITWTRIA